MSRVQDTYPRTGSWGELSDKLVRHYHLPNGSKFVRRRKGMANGTRPFLRADADVRRRAFRRDEHPRDDDVRVSTTCDAIEAMLAPPDRTNVVALGPDGEPVDRRMQLRNWRAMPGRITQAERDAAEERRQLVEDLRKTALRQMVDLEEAVDDPHANITEAVLRALVDRYDEEAVKDAIKRLRL